jgi:hypothetical protein
MPRLKFFQMQDSLDLEEGSQLQISIFDPLFSNYAEEEFWVHLIWFITKH